MGVGCAQALGFGSNIWARQCKASAAAASAGQSCSAEATKTLPMIRETRPCVPGLGAICYVTAMLLHHHEHSAHHHHIWVCHVMFPVTVELTLFTRMIIRCCQQGWCNDGNARTCQSSIHRAQSLHPSLFVLLTESQCLRLHYKCY